MKFLLKIRVWLAIIGVIATFSVSAAGALGYNPLNNACGYAKASASSTCADAGKQTGADKDNPVIKTLGWATKVISLVVGFVAIILIVVSGLNMITSAGNAEGVASARKRLTGAVIGVALASLAWIIASYVINQLL